MEPDFRYRAMTPFGLVFVSFTDEGNAYEGDANAIEYLQSVMRERTDATGNMMDPTSVNPRDFYYFCQPPGSGVAIVPPVSDIAAGLCL
jgi:hypothetical protein